MTAPEPTALTHGIDPATGAPKETVVLTAVDRCDRCGARAHVVTETAGLQLMWCAHHYAANKAALPDVVLDNRVHLA